MHTALRLGVQAAQQVRALNPQAHICFYGLYAWLNREYLLAGLADSVLAGEVEAELAALAQRILAGESPLAAAQPILARLPLPVPDRSGLPNLSAYARYEANGTMALAGYAETTRGCLHTCRHCPVVPVYHGRFFVISADTVLADVRQQVARRRAAHLLWRPRFPERARPCPENQPCPARRISTHLRFHHKGRTHPETSRPDARTARPGS